MSRFAFINMYMELSRHCINRFLPFYGYCLVFKNISQQERERGEERDRE